MKISSLMTLFLIGGVTNYTQAEYASPELLIEPSELAEPRVLKRLIVLDVRDASAYKQAHLPGAYQVDHDQWKEAFQEGKDREAWSKRIGKLGINSMSEVLLYDDAAMKNAARIWWILRYWGVQNVRLLNGGWQGWSANQYPVTPSDSPPARETTFVAKPNHDRLLSKEQLLAALEKPVATDSPSAVSQGKLQIIDTRSAAEFCGTRPLRNKRAGAIPGAIHLEWSDLIDQETRRFQSAQHLRKLFHQRGIDLDRPLSTYCQSGGRASVMAFALELMGAKNARNYYRSWNEWGNVQDTPIEPGVK